MNTHEKRWHVKRKSQRISFYFYFYFFHAESQWKASVVLDPIDKTVKNILQMFFVSEKKVLFCFVLFIYCLFVFHTLIVSGNPV